MRLHYITNKTTHKHEHIRTYKFEWRGQFMYIFTNNGNFHSPCNSAVWQVSFVHKCVCVWVRESVFSLACLYVYVYVWDKRCQHNSILGQLTNEAERRAFDRILKWKKITKPPQQMLTHKVTKLMEAAFFCHYTFTLLLSYQHDKHHKPVNFLIAGCFSYCYNNNENKKYNEIVCSCIKSLNLCVFASLIAPHICLKSQFSI